MNKEEQKILDSLKLGGNTDDILDLLILTFKKLDLVYMRQEIIEKKLDVLILLAEEKK